MHTLTNEQIIANHHESRRTDAIMELSIVDKLIEVSSAANCKLEVWPVGMGEEYDSEPYDVKTALFNIDDAQVYVIDAEGVDLGWVRLVFGNGSTLISDYTTGERLERLLSPVIDFADGLS